MTKNKVTLNIHLETFDDESFQRVVDLAEKGPIAISIAPYHIPRMKSAQIERLKGILSQEGYILGQQGLNHKCHICKDFHAKKEGAILKKKGVDPWHENYCLWFGEISEKEQEKFMKEGRKKLEEKFGVAPLLYVPPNHLLDRNTVRIAFLNGYKWIANRALIQVAPNGDERIIIIYEGEPEIDNENVYIHADRWKGDLERVIEKKFISLNEVKPAKPNYKKIEENRKMKITGKIARDFHKGYGLSEEESREIASLIYESKFKGGTLL